MNTDLKNRNAWVGGSSAGIGLATAKTLAAMGASVTICSRSEHSLLEAISGLDSTQGQVHDYVVCDYSNSKELEKSVKNHLHSSKKKYSILINNTGGPAAGPIRLAKSEEFLSAFESHLLANQLLSSLLIEGMIEGGYGRIINIISTSVKAPLPNLGVSNTIRGAVASWSKTLATELGVFGITVNNVLPGATSTGRLKSIIEKKSEKTGHSYDEVSDDMIREIPMKRFAEPEEIAAAVAFLASPAASYITGINLPVDGGRTVCL